jgi:hypothetical protein
MTTTASFPVQVLLATYNGERYLQSQLASLWAQTNQEFEVLVADDGSSDRTLSILGTAQAESGGRLRVLFSDRVGGAAPNFMRLLATSTAPYIFLCDQDDVWLPEKIELMLQEMRRLEALKPSAPLLLHSDLEVVDEQLRRTGSSFFSLMELTTAEGDFANLLLRNCVTGCATLVNQRLAHRAVTGCDKRMLMHDWWLALVAAAFGHVCRMPIVLVRYRQHGHNTLGAAPLNLWVAMRRLAALMHGERRQHPLRQCAVQAEAFLAAYGEWLSAEQREAAALAASLSDVSGWMRRRALLRLGVFRYGLKRGLATFLVA